MKVGIRLLVIAVIAILVIAIGAGIYLALNSNALVKDAIETIGSEELGTPVDVRAVSLSFSEGKGTIEGMTVANPAGFAAGNALAVESIDVVLDIEASTAEVFVIDRISVSGARIAALVGADGKTNFAAILANLERADAASGTDNADGGSGADESTPDIKLIINRFDFTDASASASAPLLDEAVQLSIDDIHLRDIGRRAGGIAPSEVGQTMMRPIVAAVISGIRRSGVSAVGKSLQDKLDSNFSEKLKGGLDQLRQFGHPKD